MSFSEFRKSEEFQRLKETPPGSFGISEQGRIDAFNNRIEAQTGMGPGQGTAITTEGSDEALMNRSIWHAEQTGIPTGADLYAGSFGISVASIPILSLKITPMSSVTKAEQYFRLSPTKKHCEIIGIDFIVSSITSGATFFPLELT